MTDYRIDPRKNGGEIFDVAAETIGEAAQLAAQKIFPKKAGLIAMQSMRAIRETGDPQGSGMFRVYSQGVIKSDHGNAFHVMEI